MATCVEGVRVFLVALKKRPVMVADNMRQGIDDSPVSTVNQRLKISIRENPYEFELRTGIFAFPLNCKVISLIEVGSVRTSLTWPLSVVGSVPLRTRY